jgi:thiamine pyrophosphate-dependent acetolactate synthase large subunit-like protein
MPPRRARYIHHARHAKVAERPMATAVHANVGLMHASMAIYNAFCDRIPMLILGATGPMDAAKRRPWIDWIHTAGDQGALIRPFAKFDDQPTSVNAAISALVRAASITVAKPNAPVYVCLDVNLQEDKIDPNAVHSPRHLGTFQVHPLVHRLRTLQRCWIYSTTLRSLFCCLDE